MTDNMLNFDQVVALTEQTINQQFALMMGETIDPTINLSDGKDSEIGIHDGVIKPPRISIYLPNGPNTKQVQLVLPFANGIATYFDIAGHKHNQDLAGWSMAVTVDLTKLAFDDPEVKATKAAKKAADKFLSQSFYTVQAILIDLINVNFSTAIFMDKKGKSVENSGLVGLLEVLLAHLRASGNPLLISINPERTKEATGINAFKPTSLMYQTHLFDKKAKPSLYSTYNMLMMNEHHPAPYTPVDLPPFQQPALVPDDPNIDGRMYISKDQFSRGYIQPVILTRLREAMSFVPESHHFFPRGSAWKLDYSTSNRSNNDGHGGFIGEKEFKAPFGITLGKTKIYAANKVAYDFTLIPNPQASKDGKLVFSGHGVMERSHTYFAHLEFAHYITGWRKIGNASASLDYNVDVTFETGAAGRFTVEPKYSRGSPQKESGEHKPGGLPGGISQKIIDFLLEILKVSSISDIMEQNAHKIVSDLDTAFEDMADFATDSLHSAEDIVVLPGAKALFFKNIGLDDQMNVQFDLAIKS